MSRIYPRFRNRAYTGRMMLSPHFRLRELTKSQTTARLGIANQPSSADIESLRHLCLAVLEPVRAQFQIPILPSSGFRCSALNAAIGGAPNSQHCQGAAVDFEVAGVRPLDLAHWIEKNLAFDKLILEYPQPEDVNAGWVHVSCLERGNRRQSLTKTRDGVFSGFPAF